MDLKVGSCSFVPKCQDSIVKGGVLIVHQTHEGKHQYEVENVLKYKNVTGGKMFVRRGDKLTQLNGVDLRDLPPEELAHMLAEGNPMLTVHKAIRTKEHKEQPPRDGDTLHPVSQESKILSFSMEMRREEEVDMGEGVGKEDGSIEEEVCREENEENGEKRDMLIVTMTKTNISVVKGRGCNSASPCKGCHGIGCSFNDVVMLSESSTVTLEEMTIYYYKSTLPYRGMPVVLNFTGSNCFLRCCKEGERVFLQVETCEKQRLRQISISNESDLSFVFYMSSGRTMETKFESALHLGWFIQISNTDSAVKMEHLDGKDGDHTFLFIIQKS
ncbi:hypothetical protein F2P81_004328 [Scophthalmus maximus]|uniref:Interleukin-1 n=1 Tax=Scophthalmus maximus TaxID=52904 RepID=A0A6A4TJD8_SCOMX|nr:hypothetical protein F2P81_004328 [Scophthalmus maximus]